MNTTNEAEELKELKSEIIEKIEELSKTLTDEELLELYDKVKEVAETGKFVE